MWSCEEEHVVLWGGSMWCCFIGCLLTANLCLSSCNLVLGTCNVLHRYPNQIVHKGFINKGGGRVT